MSKRKGKITLSWEEDLNDQIEPEISISKGKPNRVFAAASASIPTAAPLDISQIKDRVLQMELLEADSAEVVIPGDLIEEEEEDDLETETELARKIKEAKEARKQVARRDEADEIDVDEETPFWLKTRQEKDLQEAFEEQAQSRLVREDLLNDGDGENESMEGFTHFKGGLTRRLLQRDLKSSEFYDTEISAELLEEDEDGEASSWQTAQLRKGIDKGWRQGNNEFTDQASFVARQSKLPAFIPPKVIERQSIDSLLQAESQALSSLQSQLQQLEENLSRLQLQSGPQLPAIESEINRLQVELNSLTSTQTLANKLYIFLQEKEPELKALQSQFTPDDPVIVDVWEHFLDDVEDAELLDLPGIVKTFSCGGNEVLYREALFDLLRFYCKYHLMRPVSRETALKDSGLQAILDSLNDPQAVNELLDHL